MALVSLEEALGGRPPHELRLRSNRAWHEGQEWELTCVLERTAVLASPSERILRRHRLVFVEASEVYFQELSGPLAALQEARRRGRANVTPEARADRRWARHRTAARSA